MCDSPGIMYFLKKPMPYKKAEKFFKCNFWPSFSGDGVTGGRMITLMSRVTGSEFKVAPCLDKAKENLIGFFVSINIPACVIGNNAFLHILVYESAKIAMTFLKEYLKNIGVNEKYIELIKLRNAFIKSLDLTYLLKFDSVEEAIAMRDELELRINSIYHYLPTTDRPHIGEDISRSVYLNVRNYPSLCAYIKWQDNPSKKKYGLYDGADSVDPEVKKKIYSVSKFGLRIELKITEAYLKKNHSDMMSVMAWKDPKKSEKVIADVFQKLRLMLRLDEDFRHNKHRSYDFAKLDENVQKFLTSYYAGKENCKNEEGDISEKVPTLDELTKSQRYELKKKIYEKTRIDISIPWKYHKRLKAMDWLVQPKPPVLSKKYRELWPYVFNRRNMPMFLKKVKNAGAVWAYKPNVESQTSDVSDLMGDEPCVEAVAAKPYRGIGSLKIPNLANMADD